jgi:hypothetical protein
MTIRKLPFVLSGVGLLLKAALVALSGFSKSPFLVTLLTTYDPGAFAFANWGSSIFFDPRRFGPAPGEVQVFEILLVVGFGVECLLIGLLVRWFLQRDQSQRGREFGTTPR